MYAFLLFHAAEIPSLSRAQHLARFKELASSFHGPIPTLIQEQRDPTRVVFVPVYEVETPSYHQGRVVLIGDAAHAFPPILAQGAAMAIEDAVTLAELIGTNNDLDQVLRSFEAARRPRVDRYAPRFAIAPLPEVSRGPPRPSSWSDIHWCSPTH